jgi:hypothetical protein
MAVQLLDLCAPDILSVKSWEDPRAIVRLEGLGKLKKNSMASSGLETATFWAYSIAPQPITIPRAPSFECTLQHYSRFSHVPSGLASNVLPSDLYDFCQFHMRATSPSHLILRNSLFCNLLEVPVAYSFLGRNVLLIALFPDIITSSILCSQTP